MPPYKKGYVAQLERVRRYLAKIEDRVRTSWEEYDDDLWSFFQNCWHLKDWIKNDDSLPAMVRDDIEAAVAKKTAIRHCADLANRSKHLALDRYAREEADIAQKNQRVYVPVMSSDDVGTDVEAVYRVDSTTNPNWDAVDLGIQAVEEWEDILKNYGLPIE